MEGTVQAQLRLIHRVVEVLSAADVPLWLFRGWGLDARIGRITRAHGDVESGYDDLTMLVPRPRSWMPARWRWPRSRRYPTYTLDLRP